MVAGLLMGGADGWGAAKQQRTSNNVRKERQDANKQIRQTRRKLDANQRQISQRVNDLNDLRSRLEVLSAQISKKQKELAAIDGRIQVTNDSIALLGADIEKLKDGMRRSLREARTRRQSMSATSMVLQAESFRQAMKRASYVKQLEKSRIRKTQRLQATTDRLNLKKQELGELRHAQAMTIAQLTAQQEDQQRQEKQMQGLLSELRRQGGALERELADRQRRLRALDAELDRLIAAEEEAARKAAEEAARKAAAKAAAEAAADAAAAVAEAKAAANGATAAPASAGAGKGAADATPAVAGAADAGPAVAVAVASPPAATFAQSKGRLMFPVGGEYSIVGRFGRSKYQDLAKVELENTGIDIQSRPGSSARAVYPGEVTSIFKIDGYHNVVMVRHGEYLTVYANIDDLSVRKGDKVQAGQHIGKIYSDASDGNRTILHFEVRKERQKLNPLDWVKQ